MSPPLFAAPPTLSTARLTLRRPRLEDAQALFEGFTSHPHATRYMSWPTHRTLEDTRGFLTYATRAWDEVGVGTYLIEREGMVVGSSGLHPDGPHRAMTGYILTRSLWGQGYATEVCRAMV